MSMQYVRFLPFVFFFVAIFRSSSYSLGDVAKCSLSDMSSCAPPSKNIISHRHHWSVNFHLLCYPYLFFLLLLSACWFNCVHSFCVCRANHKLFTQCQRSFFFRSLDFLFNFSFFPNFFFFCSTYHFLVGNCRREKSENER